MTLVQLIWLGRNDINIFSGLGQTIEEAQNNLLANYNTGREDKENDGLMGSYEELIGYYEPVSLGDCWSSESWVINVEEF